MRYLIAILTVVALAAGTSAMATDEVKQKTAVTGEAALAQTPKPEGKAKRHKKHKMDKQENKASEAKQEVPAAK